MTRFIALAALGAAAFAPIAAQTPVERDSAGIRIVQNASRAKAPIAFRLGAPTIDLGGPADNTDDEFNKGFGFGGIQLTDGTIAVPDRVRIQFFDGKGHRTAMLGRDGAGPQEFRSLAPIEFCRTRGDTIIAGDYRNGRFAVIHGRRVVRTVAYTNFGGVMAGCFDDGTLLMQAGWFNVNLPTYPVRLSRLRADGTLLNAFDTLIFRAPTMWLLNIPTVRVVGQRVYVGDGSTSEVRVYRADGKLIQIIRTDDVPRQVTAAQLEQLLNRQRPTGRENLRKSRQPETWPAFATFFLDPTGRLWVQDRYDDFQKPATVAWTAFDPNGRILGRLEVPRMFGKSGAGVTGFGADEVHISYSDDDGFTHLRFYPIVRN